MGKARLVHAVRRIEDLQPGDHLCTFIESQAQHQSIITCFLRIGLEQGQKVLYILHDHNPQQILDYLKVAGLNLALFLERGQIVFITANDLYRRELLDKPNYPVQIIRREVKKAISAGYRALRIVEELSWAESIFGDKALDYLIEYEGLLDKYQKNSRSLMLCLYDRLVFKTDRILDVLHCHPVVIIGTEPTKSLFYIPEERKNDADFHLKSHLDAFVEHRLIEEKMLRLSAIVESSEEAIIGITIDGMIFSWNNGAELLYGYEAAEINGKPVLILAPPGRESEILNNLDQIRAGKRIEHFETVRMRKDGSLVDVSLTVCPIYDINNTITAISVTGHEITGRKRTEAELARHTRELEALYETSLEINSQPDLPTLLQEIVERSAELLGTSIGSLYLVNPDGETLDLKVIYNLPENYRGVTVRFGEGLAGRVAQNGEPLVVNDYWGWEGALDFFRGGPFVRVLGVPLKVRERVFGVVVINSNQPGVFTREDVRVVSLFADQAAIAVENARLYQSLAEQVQETEALYRAATPLLNPGSQPGAVAALIASTITSEFVSAHCSVLLLDEEESALKIVTQTGYANFDLEFLPLDGQGITVASFKSGETIYLPDVNTDQRYLCGSANTRSELVIPLKIGERILGVLNLESTLEDAFPVRERRVLSSYADRAALALENARLHVSLAEQAKETESLYRAATPLINPGGDLNGVAELIAMTITSEFSTAHCGVMIPDEEKTVLNVIAQTGYLNFDKLSLPLSGTGITVAAFKKGEPIYLPDVDADPRFVRGAVGTRSELVIPLKIGERVLGILNLEKVELDGFTGRDQRILLSYANRAALALENAMLYKAERQRVRELDALHTATSMLVSTLDVQALFERILSAATSAVPAAAKGLLVMFDAESNKIQVKAVSGFSDLRLLNLTAGLSKDYLSKSIIERRPLLVRDAYANPELRYNGSIEEVRQIHSSIVAPLLLENQVLGAISLNSETANAFTESDLRLLTSLASTMTAAIHNAQLHAEVLDLAITDPLTGLHNRRGFFDLGQHEINRALRNKSPLSAIMLDIDLLKKTNDNYGHAAGDQMLLQVANQCRKNLRRTDIVCRYGGDEFAILLPDSDGICAVEIAERLRRGVDDTIIRYEEAEIKMSITLGAAPFDEACNNLDTLLKRADEALYQAKKAGKNCVCIWPSN